ncbi:MAG: glycolate oxidase subunit GlcE, partial [Gammaproteobacteria bacterium]|nr:glycolate oxidase subunit GlcE [Gammaproteobacteria bacterium]
CGALGTLGVLLEISLKVLPRHAGCSTQVLELTPADALARLAGWNTRPLPISAACHLDGQLFVRIAGAASAVDKAAADIGGEPLDDDTAFWDSLRDQGHAFFGSGRDLWRISVAPAAPLLDLPGDSLIDWGGALRWLASDADAVTIRAASNGIGGHATLFRARDGNPENQRFEPLPPALAGLHARLKAEFDPAGILNPGRMYPEQ